MADDIVYINVEEGSKRVMNNTKLYVKLLTKFKDDKTFGEIETALASGDMETARTAAHTYKGLTANLSLTELYKKSMELEAHIKDGTYKEEYLETVKAAHGITITEIDKVLIQYA